MIQTQQTTQRHPSPTPWRAQDFDDTLQCQALLYPDEIAYLHWAGAQAALRDGSIIDLGAFLGGSSLALAQGSQSHRATAPPIHAYDYFRVTESQAASIHVPGNIGDSYLDQYKANLHAHLARITICQGFIPQWIEDPQSLKDLYPSAQPVSVLFIDCAKQWGVHHTILRAFAPFLSPGSLVIQQDFKGLFVYLAIHMYQLRNAIKPTHYPDGGTVGFITYNPVQQADLDSLWTPKKVDQLGRESVIQEVAHWFDSTSAEPLSPWIWLAAAAELAWETRLDFIANCIENAALALQSFANYQPVEQSKQAHQDSWTGEVNRLAKILTQASLNTLADSARTQLAYPSTQDESPAPQSSVSNFHSIWEQIEHQCLQRNWNKIALYCSGRHTSKLLATNWPKNPQLKVVAIIDDTPGKAGFSIASIPIISPSQIAEFAPDVIIPSTDAHESKVWPACQIAAKTNKTNTLPVYTTKELP